MAEFEALGIADIPEVKANEEKIVLYQTFSWFLTQEFHELKNHKNAGIKFTLLLGRKISCKKR